MAIVGRPAAALLAVATFLLVAGAHGATNAPPAVTITIHGKVFVSADGRAWRNVTPDKLLPAVDDGAFVDGEHGWLVSTDCAGARARLYRTADGGRTWSSKPSTFTHGCAAGATTSLDFLTDRIGFASIEEPTAPSQSFSRTDDGGRTWRFLGSRHWPPGPVHFRTASEAWLGGIHLFRSGDGGRSWRRVRVPIPSGRGNAEVSGQFTAPDFRGKAAFVAGAFPRRGKLIVWSYATTDGGRNWRVVKRLSQNWGGYFPHAALSQPSRTVAWMAPLTTTPDLFVTSDGGRRWSSHGLPFRVAELQALDARTAIATTFLGRVRVTHDGGANWQKPSFLRSP